MKHDLTKTEALLWRRSRELGEVKRTRARALWAQVEELTAEARALEAAADKEQLEVLEVMKERIGEEIPEHAIIKGQGQDLTIEWDEPS